jgi:hypothetical protein
MTFRQVVTQGALALAALVAAYFTWQRSPELAPDEIVLVDAAKNDLVSARFDDQEKNTWVELSRSADNAGPFINVHLGPQEQPIPGKGDKGDKGDKDAAPKKTPERLLRGNDAADKLFASLAPLRGTRSLGILSPDKLKDLGIDAAKRRLTLVLRNGKRTFSITAAPAGGSEPYLRDEQSGQVSLVARSILSDFQAAASVLTERRVHAFKLDEADRLTVTLGTVHRSYVVSHGENGVVLAPVTSPSKADSAFKTWHDRAFSAWPMEVLGKDEVPAEGAPQVELRIDYSARGRRLGFLELAKGAAVASNSESAKASLFARSEHTLGWLKLSVDTLLSDAQPLLR